MTAERPWRGMGKYSMPAPAPPPSRRLMRRRRGLSRVAIVGDVVRLIAMEYTNKSTKAQEIRLRFAPGEPCHSSRGDGECYWIKCPQDANDRAEYQRLGCPLLKEYDDE